MFFMVLQALGMVDGIRGQEARRSVRASKSQSRCLGRKEHTVAQHRVTFTTPRLELGNADIRLRVQKNGKVVGTMKISKGIWSGFPATHRKVIGLAGANWTS